MKRKLTRSESFAEILTFCKEFKDATDIAKHLSVTEMTSRKYMKILVDSKYVTSRQKSVVFNTMRTIKSLVTDLTEKQLLNLCEKYRVKFAKESITETTIAKAKKLEEDAKDGIVIDIEGNPVKTIIGARVFLLSGKQHWTRQRFTSDKVYASGSSLSMALATSSF